MSKFRPIRPVHPNEQLSIGQAAQLTGLDRTTIECAIDTGDLPAHTLLKRVTLIRVIDLEAWFNSLQPESATTDTAVRS
jgi:excisionase family DNA binding protein